MPASGARVRLMKVERKKAPFIEGAIASIGSIASLVLHTIFFIVAFALSILGIVEWQLMLLVLTTVVSLEAIYMAIFIQIAVNRNTEQLREVEEDIDEISEDIEELGEDVEGIQEDIEEISEDIDEIQEDVEEMSDEEKEEAAGKGPKPPKAPRPVKTHQELLEDLTKDVGRLLRDLEELKNEK